MPSSFSYSEVNQATGVPVGFVGGLADKKRCRLTYYVKMRQPAEAGTLRFIFRWRDRDSSLQEVISEPLALDGMGRIGDVVPFCSEDASGAGAFMEFEIATTGLVGEGSYDYFLEVDEFLDGN